MKWEKKDIINICKIVAFGIILYWLLQNIAYIGIGLKTLCGILSPFIIGAAIAFIVNIPMSFFEKKVFKNKKSKTHKISKLKRLLSIIISILIIFLVIIGVIFLIIPELVNIIAEIIAYLPDLVGFMQETFKQLVTDHPEVETTLANMQTGFENFNSEVIKELTTVGTGLVTTSFGVISSAISGILNAVISIIFAIYILMGKEKLLVQSKKIIYAFCSKKVAEYICKIAKLSKDSFNNFLSGQFIECIILGSLCTIGMLILQMPHSLIVGIIVAITAFIPIVGAIIGGAVGIILILTVSLPKAIIFLIFFTILQQTENNLIYPRVVGGKVGIPGILVLIAVAIGGALGGAVGMIVGLPITSVLYTLLRESTNKRLEQKKIEIK